jgi:hypothetical protein
MTMERISGSSRHSPYGTDPTMGGTYSPLLSADRQPSDPFAHATERVRFSNDKHPAILYKQYASYRSSSDDDRNLSHEFYSRTLAD